MKRVTLPVVFFIAALLSSWSVQTLFSMHANDHREEISRLINLPPWLIKLAALEFPGVAADYLMLKTMVMHGDRLIKEIEITPEDWDITFLAVDQILNLDQRFWDPYVLVTMTIPWEKEMVNKANKLLLRAAKARPNDYRPYFYLWFNYYQILHDSRTAGKYLRLAAPKPGAPDYLTTLAARMSLYSGNTREGVRFLEQMIANTSNPTYKKAWSVRLECLKRIAYLEEKVDEFMKVYGKKPARLHELVRVGLVKEIPSDPYGGKYFITKEGHVYTTSKMVSGKKK